MASAIHLQSSIFLHSLSLNLNNAPSSAVSLSEDMKPNLVNIKRGLTGDTSDLEPTNRSKRIQMSKTEFSTKTGCQSKSLGSSCAQGSGNKTSSKGSRAKAQKKEIAKQGDIEILNGICNFFYPPSKQVKITSEGSSLIGENLFKTSLADQTSEESKLENVTSLLFNVLVTPTKDEMTKSKSSNNLQCQEMSTTLSENGDICEEELPALNTLVKSSTLPVVENVQIVSSPVAEIQNIEKGPMMTNPQSTNLIVSEHDAQKIAVVPIGEQHQVSKEYLNRLGSLAPRKTKPKLKWNPEGDNHDKLNEFISMLEKSLNIKNITNEVRAIDLLVSENYDIKAAFKNATSKDNKSDNYTKLQPGYVGKTGLRSSSRK